MRTIGKALERGNKRIWHGVLRRVFVNRPLERPIDPGSIRRVLFLRYDNIGDMITTVPALHLLRRQSAALEIDVMASETNRVVVEQDPAVSAVHILPRGIPGFIRAIVAARRRQYDVVVCCLFAKATTLGMIANWIAPRGVKSTVWRSQDHAFLFSLQCPAAAAEPTMWQKMTRLVTETFDCRVAPDDISPRLVIPDDSRARARATLDELGVGGGEFMLINMSSARERNRWTEEGFRDVSSAMLAHDPRLIVVLLAVGPDRAVAERVARSAGLRAHVYPATSDVMEVAAVVAMASLVISLDTGVIHMASATGTPTVGLYVSDEQGVREWRPYGIPHRVVESPEPGAPVAAIPARDVIVAALDMLAPSSATA